MPSITITVDLASEESPRRVLHDAERAVIAATLELAGGNLTHAARLLGVHRQSVQRLVDCYGLPRGTGRPRRRRSRSAATADAEPTPDRG